MPRENKKESSGLHIGLCFGETKATLIFKLRFIPNIQLLLRTQATMSRAYQTTAGIPYFMAPNAGVKKFVVIMVTKFLAVNNERVTIEVVKMIKRYRTGTWSTF
jgi:hypothetical protein